MKNILILFSILSLASCSSLKEVEEAKNCKVYEENKYLGVSYVDVIGSEANWKGQCAILGLFWCQWLKADYDKDGTNIFLDGNGIFTNRKIVAKINASGFEYEKTFLDSIVKSHPVKIDMNKKTIHREVQLTVLGMNEIGSETLSFNKSCNQKEASLGAIILWASKNRR